MTTLNYEINRKRKGTRTFFFPTVNGKRLSRTNYVRKYEAKELVSRLVKQFGVDKIMAFASK